MITIKDVEHVSRLARLALTEEEKQRFAKQLGDIIDHFNELENIDTANVEPLAHACLSPDQVRTPPCSAILLQNAPASENGFFRVPKIGE
jgi:aspartyl-tRNA(Asn)/glutamyl-tRNA(Gln) amidotransferase subunit C